VRLSSFMGWCGHFVVVKMGDNAKLVGSLVEAPA
jgi:hypothetical protein